MTWESFWQSVVDYFRANVWNIVAFVCVLVFGLLLIKILLMVIKRLMRLRRVDEMAVRFVAATIRFALLLVLALVLLSLLGIPISGVTTALSAAVLAIGMALKDFLSNVASGIILVGSRKYKTGDYVLVGNVEGNITDINFLFTTLKTPNSTQVTLPNSQMVNNAVTNLGAYPIRRVAITIGVAYESDHNVVVQTVVDVMKSCGQILLDPAPACRLKEYSASSLDYFVTCYCDNSDYWDVYFYIMEHVWDEFKKKGISIPFTQIEMRERTDEVTLPIAYEKLPERIEKKRVATKKRMTIEDWEDMALANIVKRDQKLKAHQRKKDAKTEKKAAKANTKKKKTEKKPNSEEKKNG